MNTQPFTPHQRLTLKGMDTEQFIQLIREAAASFPDTSLTYRHTENRPVRTDISDLLPRPYNDKGINWLQSHHYRHLEYSQEIESVLSLQSQ